MTAETKQCQNCKQPFTIEPDDFAFYEKMGVPVPVLCPQCRFMRGMLWRNERSLYSGNCGLCGKRIITMYNPKSPYVVYCRDCYESDGWDRYQYGEAYDPSRPFFDQFAEIFLRAPKQATYISTGLGPNVNSDYTNFTGSNKNCYLLFNAGRCEDVMYSRGLIDCRDSLDAYFGTKIERCYETVNVNHSNGVLFGHNVAGSVNSIFLLNASGCQNCFACVNVRNKSYHFFNEPLSKDEWKKRVDDIMGSYAKMTEAQQKFEEFVLKFPRREHNNLKAVNSIGDYLIECKNVKYSFEVELSEDCKYVFSIKRAKDVYDGIGYSYNSELLLGCVGSGVSQRVIGSVAVENSHDVEYSFGLRGCEYCIGCDGLRSAKFCILNKRYSEAEYRDLRTRIVEELRSKNLYGLSMPPVIAPFAYNEGIGQDNLPLTREEAIARGFRWEEDIQMTKGQETIRPEQIPNHIRDIPDSIVNEVLMCVGCGRNYRIVASELAFYRKILLPLPRKCFNCRFLDRIKRRGPFKIYDRTCARCKKAIKTNFAPDRPEIVYCESCYQAEVV